MIVGYRYENRLRAELVIGRFEPGAAFGDRDAAHEIQAQSRYKF